MCLNRRPHQGRVHQTQLQSLISRHPGKRHVADLHQARAIAEPASSDWSTSLDIGSDSLANDPDAVFKVADVDGCAQCSNVEGSLLVPINLQLYHCAMSWRECVWRAHGWHVCQSSSLVRPETCCSTARMGSRQACADRALGRSHSFVAA